MNILVKGNSGCTLQIFERDNSLYIQKKSAGDSYSSRLKKQAIKQRDFSSRNPFTFIKVPQIIREDEQSIYYFEMEFFPSLDFISYFQQAEKKEIDRCLQYLIEYIDFIIEGSEIEKIPREIFLAKYLEVKKKSMKNKCFTEDTLSKIFTQTDKLFSSLPKALLLPIGMCHGDLSFSNILFNRKSQEIVFIDFLDSFLETPLQDMVKLRQDLKYYWSFNFFTDKCDRTKVEMVLDYMDQRLNRQFRKYDFYTNYYQAFQIMNFLRIFPYTTSSEVAQYLEKTVRLLLREARGK